MGCLGRGTRSHFTIVGSMKVMTFMLPTIVKQDLVSPPSEHPIQIVESLDKFHANLMMVNVKAETCS